MPEFTNSRVLSPAGTRLELGTVVWPRSAKYSMKRDRISVADFHAIRGSRSMEGLGIGGMVAEGLRTTPMASAGHLAIARASHGRF